MTGVDTRKLRRKYYISYTVLFAVIFCAVSGWLILTGRSLVLGGDPVAQHVRALIYYSRWLRELPGYLIREHALPAWSLSIGYGSDVITTLHFYVVGDPLNLLCALVPTAYMSVFYSAMIVARMYLMGLSFSWMCFQIGEMGRGRAGTRFQNGEQRRGREGTRFQNGEQGRGRAGKTDAAAPVTTDAAGVLAGTLTYVFSAYTIFGGWRHPFFLNPLLYMPLLIAGAEKIRTEKKSLLFTFAVAVSAASNFYFFYMIVLVTVVYVLWKLVCGYRRDLREGLSWLARLTGAALTGVLLAGVILFPVLAAFAGNPRSVSGYIFDTLYHPDYYLKFPASLVTFWSADEWGYIGLSSVAALAIPALFVRRGRKDLLFLFGLGTAALLIPAAGYALNGFAYVSNRWVWAYVLLCSYMTALGWGRLRGLLRAPDSAGAGNAGLRRRYFTLACLAAALLLALSFLPVYGHIRLNLRIELALMGAGLLVLAAGSREKEGRAMPLLFALLVLGICCNGIFGIIPSLGGVGNGYYTWDRVAGADAEIFRTESAAIRAVEGTDAFYRYSGKDLSGNSSVQDGAPSTQFYWSLANGCIYDFFEKMGLCTSYGAAYANLDDRTILNEVAAVRDFYTQDPVHVPYGYALLDGEQNPQADAFPIYRNRCALPLGITYDAVITESAFDALDPGARQEMLLTRAVVPDEDAAVFAAMAGTGTGARESAGEEGGTENGSRAGEKDGTKTGSRTVPAFTAEALKGKALIEGNTITVLEEDAKIRFRFEGTENSESYLYLGDLDYLPESGSARDLPERLRLQVRAYAGKEKKLTRTLSWFTRKEKWYAGRNDFMFSGGYHAEKLTSFVLTLPARGVYTFGELAVYTQPLGGEYEEKAAALRREVPDRTDLHTGADTLTWATGRIDARVKVTAPKLLCMQLAYSKGWRAFVDGREVPVLRTDLMFTGVALEPGEHEVTLRYRTPGLLPGLAASALGWLILAGAAWRRRRRPQQPVENIQAPACRIREQ